MNNASIFVIGFCLLYLLGRRIFVFDKKDQHFLVYEQIESDKEKHGIITIILVLVCGVIVGTAARSQGGVLNTSWSGGRERIMSKSYVSSDNITGFLYAALAGVPFVCLINKEYKYFALSFLADVAVIIITRNRVLMLPMLVSIIAFVIFKTNVRLNLKIVILTIIGAALVIYIVYAVRAFRWLGSLQNAIDNFNFSNINASVRTFLQTNDGELGLRNYFYHFIYNNNNFDGFERLSTYMRMLLVYIPTRLSFGLKPSDFAETMALAVGGTMGGSIHPTLFGDCFANAGYLGILLGLLWALIVSTCDLFIGRIKGIDKKRLAYVTAGYAFVIIGRGAVYNGFVNIAWGFLILYITTKVHLKVNIKVNKLKK